jgi:hypothetical protein
MSYSYESSDSSESSEDTITIEINIKNLFKKIKKKKKILTNNG